MGRDKALIEVGGSTLLERACQAGAEADLPTIVVGRTTGDLPERLRQRYPYVRGVPDVLPGAGPVGGLVSALQAVHREQRILVAACDVPGLSASSLLWLQEAASEQIKEAHCPGLVTTRAGFPEPLFAVYTWAALAVAEELMGRFSANQGGAPSLKSVIDAAPFAFIPLPAIHHCAVADVDTPEELRNYTARI